MARTTKIVLEDDLTGELLDEGRGETVAFGLDGQGYEIDLSGENSAEFRQAVKRYVDVARKVATGGGRRRNGSARRRGVSGASTSRHDDTNAVRAWARENGHQVADRGRVPAAVMAAYREAH